GVACGFDGALGWANCLRKRRRRSLRSERGVSNKYLKPAALAQIRNSKASSSKTCVDVGKRKVDVMDADKCVNGVPVILSPEKFIYSPVARPVDMVKESNLLRTPKMEIPNGDVSDYKSRLESLSMEVMVKILCHLHHDQLRASFHVSERVRKAAVIARQFYFNYTTPDRGRDAMGRIQMRKLNSARQEEATSGCHSAAFQFHV
ncbi:LOW QUALITY PROTEIN: hypothetical protein M8C21_019284, partial [Ambrosia artemisiifolia]